MINWITRWFKGSGAAQATGQQRAPAAPTAGASLAPPFTTEVPVIDLPLLFYRYLAGGPSAEVPAATEQLILDEFARLADSPHDGADLVPRVPAVIPQLLRSLRDDAMSGAELSRQLAQDVVLVAEVIREANSPYYSPAAPVRTIEGAVMLLGQNGMRMLLARVAFRPIISMQAGRFAHQCAPLVWRQSESCALAASLSAPSAGANVFEAYLAGLLHHVGLIVALRLIDQIYSGASLPRSAHFCARLLADARRVSAGIATVWEFPPSVAAAIAGDAAGGPSSLAGVLAAADRLAMLRLLVDAGQIDPALLPALADTGELAILEQLRVAPH
ncbi:HDOD domain-containing protein [Massilia sp. DWR3-1-1]|uniref:HDOD domain-containing protein n=1 Tax=Massilia sp. DWR3-1-1 TaxID=2804559 RepID=UPI003CEC2409